MEISTLVQIVGNDKVREVSLLTQGDTFTISAEESLDFLHKQHFPLHLPSGRGATKGGRG